ncbi:MAG TPA: hypothetical protein DDW52_19255 [Planctomycetaceae bacterium]|nr:hypothetical protein [Planctomycetaceae bacterium]
MIATTQADEGPGSSKPCAVSEAGPGNLRSVGLEEAVANVQASIEQAAEIAQVQQEDVSAVCLAAAGAGRQSEKEQLESYLLQLGYSNFIVCTDADVLLPAVSTQTGCEHNTGIALIAGTGSIAIGCTLDGQKLRSGGWGYLLGDHGSGYALGQAALADITQVIDLVKPPSRLSEILPKRIGISDVQEIIPWCYSANDAREKIAGLAPVVFEAAESNCPVARQIIEENAAKLASTCVALLRQAVGRHLQLTEQDGRLILACSGSLLTQQPDYRDAVVRGVAQDSFVVQHVREVSPHTVVSPVVGAVELARRLCTPVE